MFMFYKRFRLTAKQSLFALESRKRFLSYQEHHLALDVKHLFELL